MKQHITVEQLFELQDYKLAEVMDEEFQNAVRNLNCNPYMSDTEKDNLIEVLAEQVTIGKMIEILSNFVYDIEMFQGHGYWDTIVRITTDNGKKEYKSEWLCDALWEAVKEVL